MTCIHTHMYKHSHDAHSQTCAHTHTTKAKQCKAPQHTCTHTTANNIHTHNCKQTTHHKAPSTHVQTHTHTQCKARQNSTPSWCRSQGRGDWRRAVISPGLPLTDSKPTLDTDLPETANRVDNDELYSAPPMPEATITCGWHLERSEVLRSFRHYYLQAQSQGHHTTDHL